MLPASLIIRLRIVAFLLFLLPTIAIIGSILIHNYILSFKYNIQTKYSNYLNDIPGDSFEKICNLNNNFCYEEKFIKKWREKNLKLDDCFIYEVRYSEWFVDDIHFSKIMYAMFWLGKDDIFETSDNDFKGKEIKLKSVVSDVKNDNCIKNNFSYKIYKIFPVLFEYPARLIRDGVSLGSTTKINPFFYGETSVSNVVKRHPINIFFKSFLYISVVLMIAYWYFYNKIFQKTLKNNFNLFYFFGIGSAIFLFLHVFFLGSTSNSEIFKDIRRLIIVLFILFELLAQVFLAKNIYKNKNVFIKFCYNKIISLKFLFAVCISTITIIILVCLFFTDFPSAVDYILEWNYFVVLLVFYFISSIMWKKNKPPVTHQKGV